MIPAGGYLAIGKDAPRLLAAYPNLTGANTFGDFSGSLSGSGERLALAMPEVIKSTDIPNLFVLPCGPLPPNPAELLMSHRFETVLEELGKRFDRIILDSPPLQLVTDAVVLSKQADGVILIVHADKTLREDIKRAARQIRNVGGQIFGVVVNAIDDSRSTYYYGKYGAYYSYGEKAAEPEV